MEGDDVLDALMLMDNKDWKNLGDGTWVATFAFVYSDGDQIVWVNKGTVRTLEGVMEIESNRVLGGLNILL